MKKFSLTWQLILYYETLKYYPMGMQPRLEYLNRSDAIREEWLGIPSIYG
jgi:hypothetical protein